MDRDDRDRGRVTRDELEDMLEAMTDRIIARINEGEHRLMATLAELIADDTQLEGEVAQIITTLQDIEAQLAALKNAGLTPEQQAQVDQVAASLATLNTNISAALPQPAPAPAPAVEPPA